MEEENFTPPSDAILVDKKKSGFTPPTDAILKKKKNPNLPIKKIFWNWFQNRKNKILYRVQILKRKFRNRVL